MKIKDIRREKLRRFRDSLKRGDTELSELLDKSLSQINQIIGPNPTRGIGDALAEQIAQKLGKPDNWLDYLEDEQEILPTIPNEKVTAANGGDAYWDTIVFCYPGLSDDHKDAIAYLINKLYTIDNPGVSVANPKRRIADLGKFEPNLVPTKKQRKHA